MIRPFSKVPPNGYLIEPAEHVGFWLRIVVDGHVLSFLVAELSDATALTERLQDVASMTIKSLEQG